VNALLEPAPTPLDLTFRLFGTHVRVSAWFWVLPGVVGGFISYFLGIPYLFLVIGCFFFSVLLHEFGHVSAGHWFGQDSYVVLNGIGGVAIGCADAFERWQRIVVYAAGPAIQALAAGFLWVTDYLILQRFTTMEIDHPLVYLALLALIGINVGMAVLNMLPLGPPLDGWYICKEIFGLVMGRNRPPWEADPDQWKRGTDRSDYSRTAPPQFSGPRSNRLPLLILIGAAVLAFAWQTFQDSQIATATDLMREFKKDPDGAMGRYGGLRRVSFKAVLKKPPWEKALYQYEGGEEAMVYFVTDNPNEWLFCTVPYDDKLRELKGGAQYRVSGNIYYFESEGKLFLSHCSVKRLRDIATP